jgi:hypothetical protein
VGSQNVQVLSIEASAVMPRVVSSIEPKPWECTGARYVTVITDIGGGGREWPWHPPQETRASQASCACEREVERDVA